MYLAVVRQIYANDGNERIIRWRHIANEQIAGELKFEKKGHYVSASFATKAAAKSWATQKEAEILAGKGPSVKSSIYVKDLLMRYMDEVSPSKGGYRWDKVRLTSLSLNPLSK